MTNPDVEPGFDAGAAHIEEQAANLEALLPGLGDVLWSLWNVLKPSIVHQAGLVLAASSGAATELDYYIRRESPVSADMVNHPPHYRSHPSGIECIEITELCSFTLGNAIKYIWRAWDKGAPDVDLAKARWYLHRTLANGCASTPPYKAAGRLMSAVIADIHFDRKELLNLVAIGLLDAAIDLINQLIDAGQDNDGGNQ